MIYLTIWIIGVVSAILFEILVGFSPDLVDADNGAHVIVAACFWPIITPMALIYLLGRFINKNRKNRIEKQDQKTKLRIAQEQQLKTIEQELEQELNYTNKDNVSQSR